MYSRLELARKYIYYWITAANGKGHGIHSPFVFDFVKKVLNDETSYEVYQKVEKLRNNLLNNPTVLEVEDLGAGSVSTTLRSRKVCEITRSAAKPRKYSQLIFKIAHYYDPGVIVELGTSLGLTTCYLATATNAARVISLEGASSVAAMAQTNFRLLGIENIQLVLGNFDDNLPGLLNGLDKVDLCFIDGNHRKIPTVKYFYLLLGKISSSSILIFDDIHWSKEMEEAWEIIKAHPAVTLSIDLFFIGLVFFQKEFKIKQHFTIRY